jgi:signal peptidase II
VKKLFEKKGTMIVLDFLLIGLFLGLDQWTKYLAVLHLKGKDPIPLVNKVLELRYLENRGAAFGLLQDQKFFILFVGVIFVAVLLYFLFRLPNQKKFRVIHVFLSMIIAGGVGNMIDRFRFEYVVDFIYAVFIDFPIFNVADMCVVIATIGLLFCFLFVLKEKDLEFMNFKQNKYREMK